MKYLSLSALVLAACVQSSHADETAADFSKMDWILTTVDGQPAGYSATLNLGEPGRATGQAPCNRYFADIARDGDSFTFGAIGATRMACLQMAGEADFFQALTGVETAQETAGFLTLTGSDHVLVFVHPVE